MNKRGFTLIELLVVISIIGLMSTIAVVSLGSAKANSRNAKRKADLVQISKALELYYSDNAAYPDTGGSWRGACANGGSVANWIPGLTPNYMGALPTDPTHGHNNQGVSGGCSDASACYMYASNGTDYKVLADCTPEGGPVASTDAFYDPQARTWVFGVFSPGYRSR